MPTDEMNMDERLKYLRIMQGRYTAVDRKLKTELLNEMEIMTSLQRKYLIGQMSNPDLYRHLRHRERSRVYDDDVTQVIAVIADTLDTIWGILQTFRRHCPLPIREINSDNGSEFINHALIACFGPDQLDAHQTRGRPGYHNDNRCVEQKNSSLVRAYLADMPLPTPAQCQALQRLYDDMWLYYNFFQPVLRQVERRAVPRPNGTLHIARRQDRACTPWRRLLAAKPPLSRETQTRLQALYEATNPLALKRRVHDQIEALKAVSDQSTKEEAVVLV